MDTIDALQMDLSAAFASERIVVSLSKDPNEGLLEYLQFLQRMKVSEKLSIPEHLKPDAILSSISTQTAFPERHCQKCEKNFMVNSPYCPSCGEKMTEGVLPSRSPLPSRSLLPIEAALAEERRTGERRREGYSPNNYSRRRGERRGA